MRQVSTPEEFSDAVASLKSKIFCSTPPKAILESSSQNDNIDLSFARHSLQWADSAISPDDSPSFGGAIALKGGNIDIVLNHVSINKNVADRGGGLSIENSTGQIVIENNSQITANYAITGGGIYHNDETKLVATDVTFSQNSAEANGHDIYNAGPLELGGTVVSQDGVYLESLAAVPTIIQHLTPDSIIQLESSSYITPSLDGSPIVVAQSDLALTSTDADAFRVPVFGFDGWKAQISEKANQVILTPIVYAIQYENTKGVENPNPTSYTILTPTLLLLPLADTSDYHFLGWFDTLEDGTQITEIPTGSAGNKILYAHWQIKEYTITYHGNDTEGSPAYCIPSSQQISAGQRVQLSCLSPHRTCYCFAGWNTSPYGTGQMYWPGQTISAVSENISLYALWKRIQTCSPPCNTCCHK